MLQRQDKYLLHSCNSRLLYQTCGNGFALGSYGILYSANIFFLSRDPAGSWFQLHFLSRVQWNPGSCVKCCLGIQVTHPFLSFNNMSYEESMLDKLTSLAWRGLSNAADAKKEKKKVFDREWTTSQNELSVTTRCQSKVVHAHRSKNFKPSMFGYVECGARAQTSFYQTCTKVCTENFDFMDIGASWIRGV